MRRILSVLVCGLVLLVPVFAQAQTSAPALEISYLGITDSQVIEITTPADLMITANILWPDQDNQPVTLTETSLHYKIWRNTPPTVTVSPEYFRVDQLIEPYDGKNVTVSTPFNWAEISVNKPYCTYFSVQADFQLVEYTDQVAQSNILTFHVVPEPSALLALGTGLFGFAAFGFKRRQK